MAGRGKVGGHGRGKGHGDDHGRSEWAPGQRKKDAGEQSAREFAPGPGGAPPGRRDEDDRPGSGRARDDQDEVEPLT